MITFRRLALVVGPAAVAFGLYAVAAGDAETTYLTAPVERGNLVTTVTATGTLNAVVTVKVGSQLSGQIKDLLVDFNAEVRHGQPIAELDPETYAARVREAEAALDVAEANVRIERAAVAKARAGFSSARAALAAAAAHV